MARRLRDELPDRITPFGEESVPETSPSPDEMLAAIQAIDRVAGSVPLIADVPVDDIASQEPIRNAVELHEERSRRLVTRSQQWMGAGVLFELLVLLHFLSSSVFILIRLLPLVVCGVPLVLSVVAFLLSFRWPLTSSLFMLTLSLALTAWTTLAFLLFAPLAAMLGVIPYLMLLATRMLIGLDLVCIALYVMAVRDAQNAEHETALAYWHGNHEPHVHEEGP